MRLHEQVKVLNAEKLALVNGYQEMLRYLDLPKFSEDIMVNKTDILMRIHEALLEATKAEHEALREA